VLLTPSMIDRCSVNPLVLAIATIGPTSIIAPRSPRSTSFPYGITDKVFPSPGPVRNLDQIAAAFRAGTLLRVPPQPRSSAVLTAFERRRDIAILRSLGTPHHGSPLVVATRTRQSAGSESVLGAADATRQGTKRRLQDRDTAPYDRWARLRPLACRRRVLRRSGLSEPC
jgi:hypothetical protein